MKIDPGQFSIARSADQSSISARKAISTPVFQTRCINRKSSFRKRGNPINSQKPRWSTASPLEDHIPYVPWIGR